MIKLVWNWKFKFGIAVHSWCYCSQHRCLYAAQCYVNCKKCMRVFGAGSQTAVKPWPLLVREWNLTCQHHHQLGLLLWRHQLHNWSSHDELQPAPMSTTGFAVWCTDKNNGHHAASLWNPFNSTSHRVMVKWVHHADRDVIKLTKADKVMS